MICKTCKHRDNCEITELINNILDLLYSFDEKQRQQEYYESEIYVKMVTNAVKNYTNCSDYEEGDDIRISLKEYQKLLDIKERYEGLEE